MGRVADTRNEKRTDLSIEKTTLQNRHAASNSWKSIEKIPVWLQSSHTHTHTGRHTRWIIVKHCVCVYFHQYRKKKKKVRVFQLIFTISESRFCGGGGYYDGFVWSVFVVYGSWTQGWWGQWRISTNIQAPLIFSILCGSVALPLLAENSSHCVSYKKQKATDHKASLADVILL